MVLNDGRQVDPLGIPVDLASAVTAAYAQFVLEQQLRGYFEPDPDVSRLLELLGLSVSTALNSSSR